jgi:hypothetical protein
MNSGIKAILKDRPLKMILGELLWNI